MGDITCIIHKMAVFIVIMMFSVCILFVAMASVVYIVGYVYDSIFGNSILRLGHFIGRKHPKIKNMPMIVKAWKKFSPKKCIYDMRLRYLHIAFHIQQFRCYYLYCRMKMVWVLLQHPFYTYCSILSGWLENVEVMNSIMIRC